jgi:hypothetical protein
MNDRGESTEPADVTVTAGGAQQASPQELDAARAQLLTRLALGFVIVGAEQLSQRLRDVQSDDEAISEILIQEPETYDDTAFDLLRYLAIGAVMRGERKVVRSIYGGFRRSFRATGWLVGKLDTATDNRLARPFRRPFEARVKRLEQTLDTYVREGRIEERRSRELATDTVEEITGDVVDWIAHSPDVNQMARDVIGGQGVGLAEVAQDNARQATVTGDDALENIIRRILRKSPRDQLPPSPLAGQPQTMYAPETQLQAVGDDE